MCFDVAWLLLLSPVCKFIYILRWAKRKSVPNLFYFHSCMCIVVGIDSCEETWRFPRVKFSRDTTKTMGFFGIEKFHALNFTCRRDFSISLLFSSSSCVSENLKLNCSRLGFFHVSLFSLCWRRLLDRENAHMGATKANRRCSLKVLKCCFGIK